MSSLAELKAQREALDRQIEETLQRDRSGAIAKVKALMADYGLTVGTKGMPKPPSKVAAKYINKATNETWSGRGLKPKWLQAAINGGAKLEDFAV
jgi:DNA-binding protein H-NS